MGEHRRCIRAARELRRGASDLRNWLVYLPESESWRETVFAAATRAETETADERLERRFTPLAGSDPDHV